MNVLISIQWQNPSNVTWQLDYVFASKSTADKDRALNEVDEWGPSDHCIIEILFDE